MTSSFGLSLLALACTAVMASAQDTSMSFFVTSQNPGNGGNLGGLEGADAHCTTLAEAAGAAGKTWRAYLSSNTVDARDRIGEGPWHNAAGTLIAAAEETCADWTSGSEGSAMLGHHDRTGLDESAAAKSWNSSHPSRGCDIPALQGTGGDGLFYCFAAD